jgi:heptosyltransferase-2
LTSLVIQTAFLGDVVLTTPLLTVLAQRWGRLDVVTTPSAAPLLETHPAVRRVVPYDKHGRERGVAALWALARRLRAERYEAAYLPHRSLRTAVLARLAGIPQRVGFRDGWPSLYTDARPRPAAGHEADRLLALADAGAAPPAPVSLGIGADDGALAETVLAEGAIATPFVALAPGSVWGSKRWPYYGELAEALAERRVSIVAVGGSEDGGLGDALTVAARRRGGRAINACGRLPLRGAAALIARAAALVTNDSAPLHLAQAVGTPTIAVFGPTIPAFGFGPRGARDRALGVDGLPCRPCHRHGPPACPLGHHRCMRELPVDTVLHALEDAGAIRRRD